MKKLILIILLMPLTIWAQTEKPQLTGILSIADLKQEPYVSWFNKNYASYTPNAKIVKDLKDLNLSDYSITIFLGTWCGDSHREVPRFIKILDETGFTQQSITLVGLSSADSIYKQSPTHEERGENIYRVPTFIISKKGDEINRIVEYPVVSLERDLLSILKNEDYIPNYQSYIYLSKWLDEGLLSDDNVSDKGLANQIRHVVKSAGELNNFGYVLIRQSATNPKAALKVFSMNCFLFPDSYWVYASLAEILGELGEHVQASKILQHAIELNKDPQNVKYLLEQYDIVRNRVE